MSRSGMQDPTIGARIVERPEWWATRDSNPDGLLHTPLKRARLPVPPAARLKPLDFTVRSPWPAESSRQPGVRSDRWRAIHLRLSHRGRHRNLDLALLGTSGVP